MAKVFRVYVRDTSANAFDVEAKDKDEAYKLVHAALERGDTEPKSMKFVNLWSNEWETTGEVEEIAD
jgi:hypothetical protein